MIQATLIKGKRIINRGIALYYVIIDDIPDPPITENTIPGSMPIICAKTPQKNNCLKAKNVVFRDKIDIRKAHRKDIIIKTKRGAKTSINYIAVGTVIYSTN